MMSLFAVRSRISGFVVGLLLSAVCISSVTAEPEDEEMAAIREEQKRITAQVVQARYELGRGRRLLQDLKRGALDKDFSKADCNCSIRAAACTRADFRPVAAKGKPARAVDPKIMANPVSSCLMLYYLTAGQPDKLKASCKKAVLSCGPVRKKVEIAQLEKDIQIMEQDIRNRADELAGLEEAASEAQAFMVENLPRETKRKVASPSKGKSARSERRPASKK